MANTGVNVESSTAVFQSWLASLPGDRIGTEKAWLDEIKEDGDPERETQWRDEYVPTEDEES